MKKMLCLFLCILVILCGCNKVSNLSLDDIINKFGENNSNKLNSFNSSFKYYLPKGLSVSKYDEYNNVIESDKYKYYLYVDIISYYNKVNNDYQKCDSCYYSSNINSVDKYGYVEINLKENNQYLIEIMYNYAKIEVMVDYDDINLALLNCVSILNSLEYNNMIIESLVSNKSKDFKEETYNIFETINNDNNLLQFGDQDDSEIQEDDVKDIDLVD